MASKDVSKDKMVPKPKTNTSNSSSVPPRKYGAHSGLKFKFNSKKGFISKSSISVESQIEKKLPPRTLDAQIEPKDTIHLASNATINSTILESQKKKGKPPLPEDEKHPGLKTNLVRESKTKPDTNQSKIEKEKQPPSEDGHLVLKVKLQRDLKKNLATSESKIEKEKPVSAEDGYSGLKIKSENDSKKSAILDRKTNKEKPPLSECDGHAGLKTNLEGNSKKKSATNQSEVKKEKQPPRKYGAHSGLKFKFNIDKSVIPKTFMFESSTADTKRHSEVKKIRTVTMETFESQAHKEHPNPDVEKYTSTVKEREKTLRESESLYDAIVEENVQDEFEILSEKEIAKTCSNSVASSRDLKHQHKSPKVTKSHAGDTLKPPEIASTASNLSSLNASQISKGRPTITKEPPIPRYSHAMTARTITRQIVESEADKEERHKSGVKNYASTFEKDKESSGESESFYEVIVDENVKNGWESLSKKEIAFLCSNSVASFRDLKHQNKSPKVTNSRACSTSKPPEIASEASNLPSLNILQTSKGQFPVAKDPPVPRYSDATRFVNIAKPVGENQIHKEERHKSGVKKYETNLEKDKKTLDESEFIYDVVVEENMQDDFKISPKKERAKLRSKSIASSRVLKQQHKSSKITNSDAYDASKPSEIAPKASTFSSLNVPKITIDCPPVSKESKVYETRYSDATKFVPSAMPLGEIQTHKERHKSGVKKYETNLEKDKKTLDESEFIYDVVVGENMQDDFEISPKKERAKLRRKSIASSRVLKHQHKSSKITNSDAYDALKPSEIAPKASNFSSLTVPKISKGCPTVSKESKVYETRFSDAPRGCTIAMKVADNQMHQEERHKSGVKKYESDLDEEDVQTSPDIESFHEVIEENVQDYYEIKPIDAMSGGAVTMEIDDFVLIKKSPKSGKGKHFSTQKDDFKLGGQSGHNSISMKSVQEDAKISIENESEDLCSRVATSLRVLQPQLRALKISKSQVSDSSKPQAIVCKTSKLPMLNVPQISRGQPTKLEEPMTPFQASPRKYGFHAGLKFSFKEKKAIPVAINFNRTPSLPKDKCFKDAKRDPAS